MLSNVDAAQSSTYKFDIDKFIDRNAVLVNNYRNFKCRDIGINESIDVLEPMGSSSTVDPYQEVKAAILMENFLKKTLALYETSRADLPKWVKSGLAMIAASHVDDQTNLVISEQPMPQRNAKIHFLDIKTERAKGQLAANTRLFDALRGFIGTQQFSEEKITLEPLAVQGSTNILVNVEYDPIIPRSLVITDGNLEVRDDGNGNLVGDVGAPAGNFTNTVNYVTGQVALVLSSAATSAVTVNYSYNVEAAVEHPKYGIGIRSIQIEARPRAIMAEWSTQSTFDMLSDWGVNAEPTILDAGAKIIHAEKFKHVVNHLYKVATGGSIVFDNTNPAGISYQEHIDSFGIILSRLLHEIWKNTQKIYPNVFIISPDILFLPQYTKGFKGNGLTTSDALAGPKEVGMLENHGLRVIVDPTFPARSGVLTYRGDSVINTAAVLGTYIPLYKSPIHVQGLRKDTTLLTEYAIHVINTEMLGRVNVINL